MIRNPTKPKIKLNLRHALFSDTSITTQREGLLSTIPGLTGSQLINRSTTSHRLHRRGCNNTDLSWYSSRGGWHTRLPPLRCLHSLLYSDLLLNLLQSLLWYLYFLPRLLMRGSLSTSLISLSSLRCRWRGRLRLLRALRREAYLLIECRFSRGSLLELCAYMSWGGLAWRPDV